jgi:hypothetical protein
MIVMRVFAGRWNHRATFGFTEIVFVTHGIGLPRRDWPCERKSGASASAKLPVNFLQLWGESI